MQTNGQDAFHSGRTTGMRIGEVLGLEIDKHFADDFKTIMVRQQAKRGKITADMKTRNAIRNVDVHPDVAKLLSQFIGLRTSGLLFGTKKSKPISQSNIRNRVLYPMLESLGVQKGGSHVFRRFRATWLRKQRAPEDLIRAWLGHGKNSVTDLYVNIDNEHEWRKTEVERIGVGSTLPKYLVVPNVPKKTARREMRIAA